MLLNCTELFLEQVEQRSKELAIWIPGKDPVTFEELHELATRAQSVLLKMGVQPGACVLLLDGLDVRLYAWSIALLAMGCSVLLVEPWMPVAHIQKAIALAKPQLFLAHPLGMLWGARVPAIRRIPQWLLTRKIHTGARQKKLHLEKGDPLTPGILTFTSGTTGDPKGVVRTQGYLLEQQKVLSRHLEADRHVGPDLCIFANFVFSNLASGRGSILIPPPWPKKALTFVANLPQKIAPTTLTCGPAFLLQLMQGENPSVQAPFSFWKTSKKLSRSGPSRSRGMQSLQSIHVGGALTDCAIFEKAFEHWPDAHISHIYGGSEVEPVALTDARQAVEESKKRGYFQTLYLGKTVPEIEPEFEPNNLWVSGPHVCPEYLGGGLENQLHKRRDPQGRLWHSMGDRIVSDEAGLWYQGRSSQKLEDFLLEQRIYTFLGSSKSFLQTVPSPDGHGESARCLVGEGISSRQKEILKNFPELGEPKNTPLFCEARIYRDRRHRARIDRIKTLQKGAPWLIQKTQPLIPNLTQPQEAVLASAATAQENSPR